MKPKTFIKVDLAETLIHCNSNICLASACTPAEYYYLLKPIAFATTCETQRANNRQRFTLVILAFKAQMTVLISIIVAENKGGNSATYLRYVQHFIMNVNCSVDCTTMHTKVSIDDSHA